MPSPNKIKFTMYSTYSNVQACGEARKHIIHNEEINQELKHMQKNKDKDGRRFLIRNNSTKKTGK